MITARLIGEDNEPCVTLQVPVVNVPKIIVWDGRYFRLTGSSYNMVAVYDETSAWIDAKQMLVLPGMISAAAQEP